MTRNKIVNMLNDISRMAYKYLENRHSINNEFLIILMSIVFLFKISSFQILSDIVNIIKNVIKKCN